MKSLLFIMFSATLVFGQTNSPLVNGNATIHGHIVLNENELVSNGFVTYTNLADTTLKFLRTLSSIGDYKIEEFSTKIENISDVNDLGNLDVYKVEVTGISRSTHEFNALTKNEPVKYARVLNLAGELIKTLQVPDSPELITNIFWDGKDEQYRTVVSGLYQIVIETDENLYTNRFQHKNPSIATSSVSRSDRATLEFFVDQARLQNEKKINLHKQNISSRIHQASKTFGIMNEISQDSLVWYWNVNIKPDPEGVFFTEKNLTRKVEAGIHYFTDTVHVHNKVK